MKVERLEDGLWWWTGHLEGRGDTGSIYVESQHAISLLDPVIPPDDRQRFLRALDRDVERHGGPVNVFLTSRAKRELAAEVIERYDAAVPRSRTEDVEPIEHAMLWLPAHRTLFAGDLLAVSADGRIVGSIPQSLCEPRWIVCSSGRPLAR